MSGRTVRGKIEARARALTAERIVPPDKLRLIETILQNQSLQPEEKYQTVLNLVRTCPKRKMNITVKDDRNTIKPVTKPVISNVINNFPLEESSLNVNHLYKKYRTLKLFRKRYLIHRETRLGIGIRKRLIPTRKLLTVLMEIAGYQERLINRLQDISMMILDDETILDPTVFNYLRLLRTWLITVPLVRLDYEAVKWMERTGFERELRPYIKQYYSFLKLEAETRENIVLQIEYFLRKCPDLEKEDTIEGEDDKTRRNREKRNLSREQEIYELILCLRSFLPSREDDDSHLSGVLNERFAIESFPAFLRILTETLVVQRPLRLGDLYLIYKPIIPHVSSEAWDYSREYLKKIRKDPSSLKEREIGKLQNELAPFEKLKEFMQYAGGPRSLLHTAATQQWRMIDKNRYDAEDMSQRNFIVYIECLVRYYMHCYLPFIDGSPLHLKTPDSREWDTCIFEKSCFSARVDKTMNIMREIHSFRTAYPTLNLSAQDVKKIMHKQMITMNHAENLLRLIGDFFNDLGNDLLSVHESHSRWILAGGIQSNDPRIRYPIEMLTTNNSLITPYPVPFFDCTVESFPKNNTLNGQLKGMRILETQPEGGIIIIFIAFCFQMAGICHCETLWMDMERRKEILSRLRSLRIS